MEKIYDYLIGAGALLGLEILIMLALFGWAWYSIRKEESLYEPED